MHGWSLKPSARILRDVLGEMLRNLAKNYADDKKLVQDNPQRIKVIDASQSIEKVTDDVLAILKQFLKVKEHE